MNIFRLAGKIVFESSPIQGCQKLKLICGACSGSVAFGVNPYFDSQDESYLCTPFESPCLALFDWLMWA